MPRFWRLFVALLTAGLTAAVLAAAPAPSETSEKIKDRKDFLPHMNFHPLPGKTIGIFVSDVVGVMNQEGRSGMPDYGGFARDIGSYNWLFVPVAEKPTIPSFPLKVGEKGDKDKTFTNISHATPTTVKTFGIDVPYALVEIEVNDGLGAPADQHVVGTKMKRLDGTEEYPLVLPDVVKELQERYKKYKEEQTKALDAALDDSQKAAIKDKKPTEKPATTEVFFITWLPKEEKVRVHFRSKVTSGALESVTLAIGRRPREVKYGTMFGIEYGMGYEVDKNGKVDRVLELPVEAFKTEIPAPRAGILPPS